MKLELSTDESTLLQTVLVRHLEEMRHELAHTEDRELHRALRRDVERLEDLVARVGRALDETSVYA